MTFKEDSIYRLKNIGLPAIRVLDDLSIITRLSPQTITRLYKNSKYYYKVYSVPKKIGGERTISQPSRELKAIQGWILRNILDKLKSSPYSKGFERGESIYDNASPHIGASYLLSLDLENFFPNIKASHVFNVFRSVGYNKEISYILTRLCVYDNGLPQGAPTSPKLANLVCSRLDARISGYAGPKGITYTRYADDISLSSKTAKKILKAKIVVEHIIKDEGLSINEKKTYLSGTYGRKKITGLIVTDKSAGIGRKMQREVRSKIHHIFSGRSDNVEHVKGLLSYIHSVDNKAYRNLYRYIDRLKEKYPNTPFPSS
ncbi:retron St85 family RNA-directed DNA polymerase [Aeromonas schubertii]|uniref:retron St85 family RNA-directed DNA polymerase n=1 Tax=Aeromonas schubertii TaxID=652 RepID=UPI0038B486C0